MQPLQQPPVFNVIRKSKIIDQHEKHPEEPNQADDKSKLRLSKQISANSIDNSIQVRISQEELIVKDSTQQGLIHSIICPVCLLTLPLPYYECEECNNNFCPDCLEAWWAKQEQPEPKMCIFKCQDATFKKVKRSNTFVALLDALQFKCGACQNNFPVSSYSKHQRVVCPEVEVECENIGCSEKFKRKDLQNHMKECAYQIQVCKYCERQVLLKNLEQHQNYECLSRKFKCENKQYGCPQEPIYPELQQHQKECVFKPQTCKWCQKQIILKDYIDHSQNCQKKQTHCEWCQQQLLLVQLKEHKCDLKQQKCRLCDQMVLLTKQQQHQRKCVFESMVKLRQQNEAILQENKKLHYKINELQEILQESATNRENQTMQIISKIKQTQKDDILMDITRIDNSLVSINKLEYTQTQAHLDKMPHIFSYCMKCKELEKKFAEMKKPLVQKKKQLAQKIDDISKFQQSSIRQRK